MNAILILYVKDQLESSKFYSHILRTEPVLDVLGITEFYINDSTSLGLMPEDGIYKILGSSVPHPNEGSGIPRSEIYLFVENPDYYIERLISAGGKIISKKKLRDWGDEVAYGTDPDGHVLAFAKKAESSK